MLGGFLRILGAQCSILLHLIDICFLICICLWQISQIQTCLHVVVRPGLVSTSPAFMRSIASHPASPHGRLNQKNNNQAPNYWGRKRSTQFAQGLPEHCDSSIACRLCRLKPCLSFFKLIHQSPFLSYCPCCLHSETAEIFPLFSPTLHEKYHHYCADKFGRLVVKYMDKRFFSLQ